MQCHNSLNKVCLIAKQGYDYPALGCHHYSSRKSSMESITGSPYSAAVSDSLVCPCHEHTAKHCPTSLLNSGESVPRIRRCAGQGLTTGLTVCVLSLCLISPGTLGYLCMSQCTHLLVHQWFLNCGLGPPGGLTALQVGCSTKNVQSHIHITVFICIKGELKLAIAGG